MEYAGPMVWEYSHRDQEYLLRTSPTLGRKFRRPIKEVTPPYAPPMDHSRRTVIVPFVPEDSRENVNVGLRLSRAPYYSRLSEALPSPAYSRGAPSSRASARSSGSSLTLRGTSRTSVGATVPPSTSRYIPSQGDLTNRSCQFKKGGPSPVVPPTPSVSECTPPFTYAPYTFNALTLRGSSARSKHGEPIGQSHSNSETKDGFTMSRSMSRDHANELPDCRRADLVSRNENDASESSSTSRNEDDINASGLVSCNENDVNGSRDDTDGSRLVSKDNGSGDGSRSVSKDGDVNGSRQTSLIGDDINGSPIISRDEDHGTCTMDRNDEDAVSGRLVSSSDAYCDTNRNCDISMSYDEGFANPDSVTLHDNMEVTQDRDSVTHHDNMEMTEDALPEPVDERQSQGREEGGGDTNRSSGDEFHDIPDHPQLGTETNAQSNTDESQHAINNGGNMEECDSNSLDAGRDDIAEILLDSHRSSGAQGLDPISEHRSEDDLTYPIDGGEMQTARGTPFENYDENISAEYPAGTDLGNLCS